MGSFSDYTENLVLDYLFGTTAKWATLFVCLSTSNVDDAGSTSSIHEPSTASAYQRVAVANTTANWAAAASGAKTTVAAVTFPEATGDWGTITDFFITTSSTGYTVVAASTLAVAKAVTSGDTVSFAIGDIDITLS